MNFLKVVVAALVSIAFVTMSHAANYDNPIEGRLKGVYSDFISISISSNVDKSAIDNDKGELAIKVNAQTAYENFHQLTDLKVGDQVRVAYKQEPARDRSQATNIAERITRIDSNDSEVTQKQVTTTTTTVVTTNQMNSDSSY